VPVLTRENMQPEFLSGEASANPAVPVLLAGARRLAEAGFGRGALCARNGPRVTTHANLPFELLTDQDFLEVADYDPHLDRLLCIGKRDPTPHAGLVHLIFRAKKEIGALALVEAPAAVGALPAATRGRTTLENALGILEALRGRDAVAWGNYVVATGRSADEALALAARLVGAPA